ncbi:MAG: hypothetical protein FJX80_14430 [Bacteroidetes bacterium]|nr:hypothetical protein [Bacteroidota bacterium]
MDSSKITPDILENYAAQFKNIETCIHDFQVVLNQKNVDDLIWVLPRIDSFKNIYHENFLSEITDDLKERKLGKSLNEIKLHICSNRLLMEIDRIINIEIIDKYKIILDDWVDNKMDSDHNPKDILYNLNKFTIWTLLNVKGLLLIWDKKDLGSFPISEFISLGNKVRSLEFQKSSELVNYIEVNKDKSRMYIFKGKIIAIESNLKSAKYYLKELTTMLQP